jgi:hypothetical protein
VILKVVEKCESLSEIIGDLVRILLSSSGSVSKKGAFAGKIVGIERPFRIFYVAHYRLRYIPSVVRKSWPTRGYAGHSYLLE